MLADMKPTHLARRKPTSEEIDITPRAQGFLRLAGLAAACALLLSFHQVVAQQVREAPMHRTALRTAARPMVALWCSATADARARTRCGDGEVPNNLLLPPLPGPPARPAFLHMQAAVSGTRFAEHTETRSSRLME
ncbi:MAG TPA: hypothetical protein VFP68_24805 [Burkholderiaceae bacterium]|nr:hypothetical protein [Burkholderiaceae bacterium]